MQPKKQKVVFCLMGFFPGLWSLFVCWKHTIPLERTEEENCLAVGQPQTSLCHGGLTAKITKLCSSGWGPIDRDHLPQTGRRASIPDSVRDTVEIHGSTNFRLEIWESFVNKSVVAVTVFPWKKQGPTAVTTWDDLGFLVTRFYTAWSPTGIPVGGFDCWDGPVSCAACVSEFTSWLGQLLYR